MGLKGSEESVSFPFYALLMASKLSLCTGVEKPVPQTLTARTAKETGF